jgi:hypothetical protein
MSALREVARATARSVRRSDGTTALRSVTTVTATWLERAYLSSIEAMTLHQREPPMTKFFSLFLAAALFAPAAYAALNQAALIVS